MPMHTAETQTAAIERQERQVVEIVVLVLDERGNERRVSRVLPAADYRAMTVTDLVAEVATPAFTQLQPV